jgi:hypothetical protein
MLLSKSDWLQELRVLLILGRVSNLPTVWSNCLAGWILGGGGSFWRFLQLCFGTTCLYVGGMFLNDAFDAEFDRANRKERPIPSGAISSEKVWLWGSCWLSIGTLSLMSLGRVTPVLTLCLAGSIVLYDAVHKAVTFSPVLMAACRFFLYAVAASSAAKGITGLSIWSGLALGAYIIGLSYLARKESTRGPLRYWPCSLLVLPILLAWIVNDGSYAARALLLSVMLLAWIVRCLRYTFWKFDRNVGRTVSGLLAGIVLVDLLAVSGVPTGDALIFVFFFAAALLFQRFVPAT